jgi:hypothetical protein
MLMTKCEEVARLVSEGLDRKLSFGERLRLKVHHQMCKLCANHSRQILFLHRALEKLCCDNEDSYGSENSAPLSQEAKERIKAKLVDQSRN